ncbi:MAG: hypothetical protein ABEJ28_02010 [Salinigranum sp.]
MGALRKLSVAVTVFALVLLLVSANLVVGAHRTVLDPGFTKGTLAKEGGYRMLESGMRRGAAGAAPSVGGTAGADVVSALFTRSYLRRQVGANVDRAYAYLHGRRRNLSLWLDLRPVKRNVSTVVTREIRDRSVSKLLDSGAASFGGPGGENGSVAAPGASPSVNATLLATLTRDRQGYRTARGRFRERIRDRVLTRMTDRAYANASNDQRLALVIDNYDPNNYTASEKRRMVSDRKPEIRAAMRRRISENRSGAVDDAVAAAAEKVASETASANTTATGDAGNVSRATRELGGTLVGGLTAPEANYTRFRSRLKTAKGDFADAVGRRAAARFDGQAPDRVSLTDRMGPTVRRDAATARKAVRALDALGVALPLIALLVAGLLFRLSRSVAGGTALIGGASLLAGAVTWIPVAVAKAKLPAVVGDGPASPFVTGAATRVANVVSTQSAALVVLGVCLLAAAAYVRRRGIPWEANGR